MIDPDTPDSLPGDTPSGQESGAQAAPDPREVKAAGEESSAAKDTAEWITGDEPMTGPQASYLATLAQQAGVEVPGGLTKAQASEKIDELQAAARG